MQPPENDTTKETDDVSGPARAALDDDEDELSDRAEESREQDEGGENQATLDPDASAAPPLPVSELAAACVRFVAGRYGARLDFAPETLSFVDQWIRDARADLSSRPEAVDLVQSAAGAYLGEVIRRQFGGVWFADGDHSGWRLHMSTVYCAFNPIGMAREALLLASADGWHAHFELDPGERDAVQARLEALPPVEDEDYYAPSTRYDVVSIVVDGLRAEMQARGLGDVRFTPDDYQ
ncbi:MAG: hypothetical protein M3O50_11110 [Myxococcota bacterium]|nr:hypothetical protein [Myxococcota bacterium]